MMFRRLRKGNKYRPLGKNLIAANKINPEQWHLSDTEVKEALQAKGYQVKQIKKVHCLKYQLCISFWDQKGNVCSSFFSYRIFARWQQEVEKLANTCPNIKAWMKLNHIMQYEFAYYHYPSNVERVLQAALENRLCVLKTTAQEAVSQVI